MSQRFPPFFPFLLLLGKYELQDVKIYIYIYKYRTTSDDRGIDTLK